MIYSFLNLRWYLEETQPALAGDRVRIKHRVFQEETILTGNMPGRIEISVLVRVPELAAHDVHFPDDGTQGEDSTQPRLIESLTCVHVNPHRHVFGIRRVIQERRHVEMPTPVLHILIAGAD
jgi:hypothetical protein